MLPNHSMDAGHVGLCLRSECFCFSVLSCIFAIMVISKDTPGTCTKNTGTCTKDNSSSKLLSDHVAD